jgi:hypothetical protein
MFTHLIQRNKSDTSESGFVLVLSMVILLVLTLLGAWALHTSTSELQVAGGLQQAERQFNVVEGAAYAEAGKFGFSTQGFYEFKDSSFNGPLPMVPTTDSDFDPWGDTATIFGGINSIDSADSATWPWQNLFNDNAVSANEFDYHYLVTWVNVGPPPLDEFASAAEDDGFKGYYMRIQGAARDQPLVVELGGVKIGK